MCEYCWGNIPYSPYYDERGEMECMDIDATDDVTADIGTAYSINTVRDVCIEKEDEDAEQFSVTNH